MAYVNELLYEEGFTGTSFTVTHNLDRYNLDARIVCSGSSRPDLIDSIEFTNTNERNEFTVNLTSSNTGIIQILDATKYPVNLPTPENSFKLSQVSSNPSVLTNKILYVDALNGNDSDGVRGNMNLPYLTISGANQSATTGDTIHIRPGTYQENDIAIDGISYYFDKGAIVHPTEAQQVADDKAIIDIAGFTNKAYILGYGTFISDNASYTATRVGCIYVASDEAHIEFDLAYMRASTGSGGSRASVNVAQTGTDDDKEIFIRGTVKKDNSQGGAPQTAMIVSYGNVRFEGKIIQNGTGGVGIGLYVNNDSADFRGVGDIYCDGDTAGSYAFLTNSRGKTLWYGNIVAGNQSTCYAYKTDSSYTGQSGIYGEFIGAIWLSLGGLQGQGSYISGIQICNSSPNGYAIKCDDGSYNVIDLVITSYIDVFNVTEGGVMFQGTISQQQDTNPFITISGGKFIFNGLIADGSRRMENSVITGGEVIIQSDLKMWGQTSPTNEYIFKIDGGTLRIDGCKVESTHNSVGSGVIEMTSNSGNTLTLNGAILIGKNLDSTSYSIKTPTTGPVDIQIYNDSYTNRPVGPGTINNTVPNGGFLYDLTGCTTVHKYCDLNISGNTTTIGLSANTLSGGTVYSGSTDLSNIFISGSGTDNTIPLWDGTSSLDDSIITQQLSTGATISGELKVSDKVGIGTIIPSEKLHISGSGTVRAHIQSSGAFSYLKVENSSTSFGVGVSNSLFGFWDYDVSQFRMVINTSGEVGIGTTNPQEFLHVVGSIRMVDGSEGSGKIAVSDASGTLSFSGVSDIITDSYVTGATLNSTTLELERNNGLADVTADLSSISGTVTSVGGAGTVNGLTLGGTVTNSGNLTLGGTLAIGNGDWSGADLAIANGGTGQSSAQDAINSLTQVSSATNEYILTKDTSTGNATWKAAAGGGTDSYVTGATLNSTTLELERNEGLADVTVDLAPILGPQKIINLTSTDTSSTFTRTSPLICPWDVETYKDAGFTHSNTINNTRITIVDDGTYQIAASIRIYDASDQRAQTVAKILINGVVQPQPYGSAYIRNSGNASDYWSCVVNPPPIKLNAGDYVEVQIQGESVTTTTFSSIFQGDESSFSVIKLDGIKGDKGDSGTLTGNTGVFSDTFSGLTTDATYYGDGSNLTGIAATFGSHYYGDGPNNPASNSTNTYVNAATITTGTVPAGKYRVGWSYEGNINQNKEDRWIETRVWVDNTSTLLMEANQTMRDDNGYGDYGGFNTITFGSDDAHSINLDWRRGTHGSATIRNASIEFWRIS